MFADFLLEVVPWFIQTGVNVSNLPNAVLIVVAPVTSILVQLNRMIRVIIYIWKLKDICTSFIAFIHCRISSIRLTQFV